MDAWAHNKKALERIDTSTAVVPALASTGIFLGLSALAAGWYLSKGNREVGIVRRTGRPSRAKRDVGINNNGNGLVNAYPQEVDQATFFQSIIQQSLEKTQQQYEDQLGANSNSEPVYNNEPQYSNNREVEQQQQSRPKNSRVSNHRDRPQNRDDSDYYSSRPSSKYAQEKSGPLTVASSKNFAKVFIPALILGVSVLAITGLIFGWYITGANREIAFLEPSSYSRKKRSLSPLSDGGWLHRTISALHKNPYDRIPAPTSKSLLPHPFMETETSKTSDLEFKISNSGITGVLAGGALIAIMALGLANSFGGSESRGLKSGKKLGQGLQGQIVRAPRSLAGNGLEDEEGGLMSSVYSAIDGVQGLLEGLHSVGLFDPREPCSKKLVCELLKDEDDETVRHTERRVEAFINILPPSLSKPLSEVLGQIVTSVAARDCSAFSCQSNNNSHHTFGNVSIKKLK